MQELLSGLSPVARIIVSLAVTLLSGFLMTRFTKKLSLPNVTGYIVAGILFSYYYEKGGFACSATAHVVNNLVALSISAMQASNS